MLDLSMGSDKIQIWTRSQSLFQVADTQYKYSIFHYLAMRVISLRFFLCHRSHSSEKREVALLFMLLSSFYFSRTHKSSWCWYLYPIRSSEQPDNDNGRSYTLDILHQTFQSWIHWLPACDFYPHLVVVGSMTSSLDYGAGLEHGPGVQVAALFKTKCR